MHIDNFNKIIKDTVEMSLNSQKQLGGIWFSQDLHQASVHFWQDMSKLWIENFLNDVTYEFDLDSKDRRFVSDAWHDNEFANFIRKSYLLYAGHVKKYISNLSIDNKKDAQQLEFFVDQIINACSPSNFFVTNPDAWQVTKESNGLNLVRGMDNFWNDFLRGEGILNQKMTDLDAFEIGKNIAATAGDVIFKNDLIELIHYKPLTKNNYERPLLIVPPWINKYYVMDLSEKNSFVKWIVEQGFSVCLISWINPSSKDAANSFEKYIQDGVIAATEVVQKLFDVKKISALGYCNGGTLLSMTAAYYAAKRSTPFDNLTYLTSLMDFSDPGDIDVFIDENWYNNIVKSMSNKGYLDGRMLALAFNLLRVNDLYWSFYVNNYLLNNEPKPFDLLYWNSDATNLSANMYSFYLKELYLENNLVKPGSINILGVDLDLTKIKTPAYFLSAIKDHIAPWSSTYAGALLHKGPVEFVLSGSGHIAGVINHPDKNKYGYKTSDKLYENAENWLEASKNNEGSWWSHWASWLAQKSGGKVKAIHPGSNKKFPSIGSAPGEYVRKSYLKNDNFDE